MSNLVAHRNVESIGYSGFRTSRETHKIEFAL